MCVICQPSSCGGGLVVVVVVVEERNWGSLWVMGAHITRGSSNDEATTEAGKAV